MYYCCRVIIGAGGVRANASNSVSALIHHPMVNCSDRNSIECAKSIVETLGESNLNATLYKLGTVETPSLWKIQQVNITH